MVPMDGGWLGYVRCFLLIFDSLTKGLYGVLIHCSGGGNSVRPPALPGNSTGGRGRGAQVKEVFQNNDGSSLRLGLV